MSDVAEANRRLIRRFYEAFDDCDGEAMARCYLPQATFRDPVFGTLTGEEAGNMWRMLTGRARELKVELLEYGADETTGRARWQARYEFAATGRPVINDVTARFRFSDGLIAEHVDGFSFFAWARQALGPTALAVGWSPPGRRLVRRRARAELDRYQSS
jgi:ketosteroid isomerase-like protein